MAISVQPLVLTHSFTKARLQATDRVDAAALDAALAQITDKLNEVITALDVTMRDDDTLRDGSIEPRHLTDEVLASVTSLVNEAVDAQ